MTSRLAGWIPRLGASAVVAVGLLLVLGTLFGKKPVSVRVTAVSRGRVEQTVTNSRAGTVKARRRAKLSPEIGGPVVALPHAEGSRVTRGDLLLRVDAALQRGRLEVAERELTAATAQREQACLTAERAGRELLRTESLTRDGILSADLLDQVRSAARAADAACQAAAAGVERARSAVALVRTELEKTALFAPFDGVVARLSIQVGEWTTPAPTGIPIPPVIDLIDPSSIYLSAPMDEVDSARIHAGQTARVTVDSHPGRSFPARVTRIAPYVLDVEAQNRTVEIEAEMEDQELARTLLPGTSADVEVVLGAREGVLRVPTTALGEGGRVLVVEGGRLAEHKVKTGVRNWDFTEIESGLAEADRVVVSLDRPEVKAGARARVEAEPTP